MNVFEDLIEELKEENLLEETVFQGRRSLEGPVSENASAIPAHAEVSFAEANPLSETVEPSDATAASQGFTTESAGPTDQREFYRRRAMDEVSSLQMVEHVLSGIEREHMKMTPTTFDDLAVKKALHRYLQISADINSDEHTQAEHALMQETENWFSALSKRDSNISVANIRRFCENSKPVLSSQALMALARFYRNSSYSEPVRGKFDFIMTRLFSRDLADEQRRLLFPRDEMVSHIKTLYSNWASLSLYEADEDSQNVSEASSRFLQFVNEAETAENFDALISSDFFNRLRLFKEETSELFFETEVTATAIECNVRTGNRFVDLILAEREASNAENIGEKYGYTYDTIISNAASKTLLLVDLLREEPDPEASEPEEVFEEVVATAAPAIRYERSPINDATAIKPITVNKWLVAATILVVVLSASIYFWSENAATTEGPVEMAQTVDISATDLNRHIQHASTSSETLYAITQTTWNGLSDDEKKAFLAEALTFAKTQGLRRVNLLSTRGRTVGYAADGRIEVFDPQ